MARKGPSPNPTRRFVFDNREGLVFLQPAFLQPVSQQQHFQQPPIGATAVWHLNHSRTQSRRPGFFYFFSFWLRSF
jgi:hypothetical protein